jgi:trans-aconitate methyltransferase
MMDATNYWESRYTGGGNSGLGSYGEENAFKFSYIKEIIETYNLKSINDFGCGDGNQVSQLRPPYIAHEIAYKGWDVSEIAVNKCTEMYKDVSSHEFSYDISEWDAADLGLSLDVLYHIVDEDIFYTYLENLFNKSKQYVIIYAVNHDLLRNNSHIYSRAFVDYVVEKYDCELVDTRPYPDKIGRGDVTFYLFKK